MTSTNDGKDVKSNQTSGQKGKKYYIDLYKSLEAALEQTLSLPERTEALCEAWGQVRSLCLHSAVSTHPHLLAWIQRHTAKTLLQSEWQKESSSAERSRLEDALSAVVGEEGVPEADWDTQLRERAEWFIKILPDPWGHPVLKQLIQQDSLQPSDDEVLEWLKEERGVVFKSRLRQLASSKGCADLALALATAVMVRARGTTQPEDDEAKDLLPKETAFKKTLKDEAGFTGDVWELVEDLELVMLHKQGATARCIELAKQIPLRAGYATSERLRTRLDNFPQEKKIWKNAKDVATIIAQVVIARCMVRASYVQEVHAALYLCTKCLVRLLPPAARAPALAALAAPAAAARHLHTLAAATHAQLGSSQRGLVCELYVRAITAGMNELERLKLTREKEPEARVAEQTLSSWFSALGSSLGSPLLKRECLLTAFSVYPAQATYELLRDMPEEETALIEEIKEEQHPASEFGSWANDSRSNTNLVKTSATLKISRTAPRDDVLSLRVVGEGEGLGLGGELCHDLASLLRGPRLKTLSWAMDRTQLLSNCRSYMERGRGGARSPELRFLNLDPRHYLHLPEEDDGEGDLYYGIEKGYEHLVEIQPEPEEIWADAFEQYYHETTDTSSEPEVTTTKRRKKKKPQAVPESDEDDPLSLTAEKKKERAVSKEREDKPKKERPHSKERSKKTKKDKVKKDVKDATVKKEKKKRAVVLSPTVPTTPHTGPALASLIGMRVSSFNTSDILDPQKVYKKREDKPKKEKSKKKDAPATVTQTSPSQNISVVSPVKSESSVQYDGVFSVEDMLSPQKASPNVPKVGDQKLSPHTDVKERIVKLIQFRKQHKTPDSSPNNIRSPTQEQTTIDIIKNLTNLDVNKTPVGYGYPSSQMNKTPPNQTYARTLNYESDRNRTPYYSDLASNDMKVSPQTPSVIKVNEAERSNEAAASSFKPISQSLPNYVHTQPMDPKVAQNFQKINSMKSFLEDIQVSLNAGAIEPNKFDMKTPQKSVINSKCAKTQKKAENSLNTFSRRSYLHKNKIEGNKVVEERPISERESVSQEIERKIQGMQIKKTTVSPLVKSNPQIANLLKTPEKSSLSSTSSFTADPTELMNLLLHKHKIKGTVYSESPSQIKTANLSVIKSPNFQEAYLREATPSTSHSPSNTHIQTTHDHTNESTYSNIPKDNIPLTTPTIQTPLDWETVLDKICSYKTPDRGPNALEMTKKAVLDMRKAFNIKVPTIPKEIKVTKVQKVQKPKVPKEPKAPKEPKPVKDGEQPKRRRTYVRKIITCARTSAFVGRKATNTAPQIVASTLIQSETSENTDIVVTHTPETIITNSVLQTEIKPKQSVLQTEIRPSAKNMIKLPDCIDVKTKKVEPKSNKVKILKIQNFPSSMMSSADIQTPLSNTITVNKNKHFSKKPEDDLDLLDELIDKELLAEIGELSSDEESGQKGKQNIVGMRVKNMSNKTSVIQPRPKPVQCLNTPKPQTLASTLDIQSPHVIRTVENTNVLLSIPEQVITTNLFDSTVLYNPRPITQVILPPTPSNVVVIRPRAVADYSEIPNQYLSANTTQNLFYNPPVYPSNQVVIRSVVPDVGKNVLLHSRPETSASKPIILNQGRIVSEPAVLVKPLNTYETTVTGQKLPIPKTPLQNELAERKEAFTQNPINIQSSQTPRQNIINRTISKQSSPDNPLQNEQLKATKQNNGSLLTDNKVNQMLNAAKPDEIIVQKKEEPTSPIDIIISEIMKKKDDQEKKQAVLNANSKENVTADNCRRILLRSSNTLKGSESLDVPKKTKTRLKVQPKAKDAETTKKETVKTKKTKTDKDSNDSPKRTSKRVADKKVTNDSSKVETVTKPVYVPDIETVDFEEGLEVAKIPKVVNEVELKNTSDDEILEMLADESHIDDDGPLSPLLTSINDLYEEHKPSEPASPVITSIKDLFVEDNLPDPKSPEITSIKDFIIDSPEAVESRNETSDQINKDMTDLILSESAQTVTDENTKSNTDMEKSNKTKENMQIIPQDNVEIETARDCAQTRITLEQTLEEQQKGIKRTEEDVGLNEKTIVPALLDNSKIFNEVTNILAPTKENKDVRPIPENLEGINTKSKQVETTIESKRDSDLEISTPISSVECNEIKTSLANEILSSTVTPVDNIDNKIKDKLINEIPDTLNDTSNKSTSVNTPVNKDINGKLVSPSVDNEVIEIKDDLVTTAKTMSKSKFKTAIERKQKECDLLKDFISNIKIDNVDIIPSKNGEPVKKIIRIRRIQSNDVFKITVYGNINVDVYSMFHNPQIRSMIMDYKKEDEIVHKKFKLNINIDPRSKAVDVSDQLVFTEDLVRTTKLPPEQTEETIDLISDDEEETEKVVSFKNDQGSFKISRIDTETFCKHKLKLSSKCSIPLTRCDSPLNKSKDVDLSNVEDLVNALVKEIIPSVTEKDNDLPSKKALTEKPAPVIIPDVIELDDSSNDAIESVLPDLPDINVSGKTAAVTAIKSKPGDPAPSIIELTNQLLSDLGVTTSSQPIIIEDLTDENEEEDKVVTKECLVCLERCDALAEKFKIARERRLAEISVNSTPIVMSDSSAADILEDFGVNSVSDASEELLDFEVLDVSERSESPSIMIAPLDEPSISDQSRESPALAFSEISSLIDKNKTKKNYFDEGRTSPVIEVCEMVVALINKDKERKLNLNKLVEGRTSPVMAMYDVMAHLINTQKANNARLTHVEYCDADWFEAKKSLSEKYKEIIPDVTHKSYKIPTLANITLRFLENDDLISRLKPIGNPIVKTKHLKRKRDATRAAKMRCVKVSRTNATLFEKPVTISKTQLTSDILTSDKDEFIVKKSCDHRQIDEVHLSTVKESEQETIYSKRNKSETDDILTQVEIPVTDLLVEKPQIEKINTDEDNVISATENNNTKSSCFENTVSNEILSPKHTISHHISSKNEIDHNYEVIVESSKIETKKCTDQIQGDSVEENVELSEKDKPDSPEIEKVVISSEQHAINFEGPRPSEKETRDIMDRSLDESIDISELNNEEDENMIRASPSIFLNSVETIAQTTEIIQEDFDDSQDSTVESNNEEISETKSDVSQLLENQESDKQPLNLEIIASDNETFIEKTSINETEISNASTLIPEELSGIILKGLEYQDPVIGTCYIFRPITDSSSETDSFRTCVDSPAIGSDMNDVFEAQITDEDSVISANVSLDSSGTENLIIKEDSQPNEESDSELTLLMPTKTYRRKNNKRKISMHDIKIPYKKYRKGKNIDYPMLTAITKSESSYSKEFNLVLNYIKTLDISYSRLYHKDVVDVDAAVTNWPIADTESPVNLTESKENSHLFVDHKEEKIQKDQLGLRLDEEISSDYLETEFPCSQDGVTNFNMGFGEGSGRVIQNFIGGGDSKISAATLSDVKHAQPFILSEERDNRDVVSNVQRYLTYVKMRERVRSFFEKSKIELSNSATVEKKPEKVAWNVLREVPGLYSAEFFTPAPFVRMVNVVQVGQLPVSAAAQNPVSCDPRVTQVSDASPSQCSENSPGSDNNQTNLKAEYTELTTADLSFQTLKSKVSESQPELNSNEQNMPQIDVNGSNNTDKITTEKEISHAQHSRSNNIEYHFETNNANFDTSSTSFEPNHTIEPTQENGQEKTDQIAHAMTAAGISDSETNRPHPLIGLLSKTIHSSEINEQNVSENFIQQKQNTTSINAMALQQALAQILPPPLNQTVTSENNQEGHTPQHTPVLHIVQGKNAAGNPITLVDSSQQSVLGQNVLHIVQQNNSQGQASNGTPSQNYSGLSLVDAGLQQGGNQLLHIVNTGNQKAANAAGQILKRVNLLTNLANVQGNEQKMVQFVCKSADGKSIHLNAPHQRSMVLRLQPIETPVQQQQPKPVDQPDGNQEELKSRSIYEENYAKFIQTGSATSTPSAEKATSLPKFNQAFGKPVFEEGNQKDDELNNELPMNEDGTLCAPSETSINMEHINQISSPPLLLRKTTTNAQTPQSIIQQIKNSITPMNIQTMHGGVIYTRQIPVNIGGGQTINLITVPTTELVDESGQKQETNVEPSIIKIVPQTNPENQDEGRGSNETPAQQPQPQQVLTQMRIKLPMLSKSPQVVPGTRVVRPSFFQIQRNVVGGGNQPVYQQLVLTAAPPLGQQTIRLPQAPVRPVKPMSETPSPSESELSSSTLEQLREFDMVLEQVKERSIQPSTPNAMHTPSTTDSTSNSSQNDNLYSIGANQTVTFVRKSSVTTPTTSTFVRSPDSTGIVDSPSSATIPQTVTDSSADNGQPKPKISSKSIKSKPKTSTHTPSALKVNHNIPPKTSTQKPLEDEQTTQRILYILAEYKEQVENSPDKDKPAPRRRSNPPANPGGSSKRKKSSGSRRPGCTRDHSPIMGDDSCRTMGSEDSSCGTSQGDCTESCNIDAQSPQSSPQKVVRKLTFEPETQTPPVVTQPRPSLPPRNVIVADGQTITVARSATGKPTTAVLMPANYILPVSMVKGGQQIAIVTNRGPKLLTVGGTGGEGGATTNALLLQRLIGPAGLKPMLARPGIRHVRLPTAALHNLQAFNLAATTNLASQTPDSTASPAPAPTPELVETRAASSPWTEEAEAKPEASPKTSEPWNIQTTNEAHEYTYEENVSTRAGNADRTVLDAIPDRYSPDMEAQRIFDKMFEVDPKKSFTTDSSPRATTYDLETQDCEDRQYQVVHKKDGSTAGLHRVFSAAQLRHKYAILEQELRLQKSLSEECEDLGVDSPSASELFPEAELLFAASPAHDHHHDHQHVSATQQALTQPSQPDIEDQIATDTFPPSLPPSGVVTMDGLSDVGIVSVGEDGNATIEIDQEEFARSHPNTTFHQEPPSEDAAVRVQPFAISSNLKPHIASTIFHTTPTVLMTAQPTVISQGAPEPVKYSDIDNIINNLPSNNQDLMGSVLVKEDGLTRYDNILTDSRELHLSNTASAIVHSNVTQVIRRVCYEDKRDGFFDEPDNVIAGDDAKMSVAEDSSREATLESMADVEDDRSSPERHAELFWESNSASERSESRRPLDFSSDSEKCCKSPSLDDSTDSSGVGTHMRLDSVIKEARTRERSGSADGSSADDSHPPIRTYPAKRTFHSEERSLSGKTRAGERLSHSEVRRRASGRGVVKRGCHCCNGSPAPPRPKKPRQRKPTLDFSNSN